MNTLETNTSRYQKYRCTICKIPYTSLAHLARHTIKMHEEYVPKNISIEQFLFDCRNPNSKHICPICKKNKVKWNQETLHYDRFCDDEKTKCKEKAGILAKQNMIRVHGKEHLLNDPNQQRKMLEARSISGKYKFKDGREQTYVGTYELDFLRFYDQEMRLDSNDIDSCYTTFFYVYNGEKLFYIPDFYIASLNLIIEIKDGGDNPNMHHKIQDVDKEKEKLKDAAIIKNGSYNYIKIVDKDYTEFVNLIQILKNLQDKQDPYIIIPE